MGCRQPKCGAASRQLASQRNRSYDTLMPDESADITPLLTPALNASSILLQ